jgi:hypothetical protein
MHSVTVGTGYGVSLQHITNPHFFNKAANTDHHPTFDYEINFPSGTCKAVLLVAV